MLLLRCATSTVSLSDRRDKTDIIDCNYGLDFRKLRPCNLLGIDEF